MTIPCSATFRRNARRVLPAALLLLALAGGGCTTIRSIGKGQHIEPGRPAPHHTVTRGGKEMIVEVTTDANGAVTSIHYQKSSGSEAVDNYVAETIRAGWPPVASTLSVARVRHTGDGGFSEPEIISTTPVP